MESAWILHLRLEPSSTAASGTAVGSVPSATIQGALTMGAIQDAAAFGSITAIPTSTGAVVF